MASTEQLNERYREKIRDRNLGRVEVKTYPANSGSGRAAELSDIDARFAAKMANHGKPEAKAEGNAPEPEKAPEKKPEAKAEGKSGGKG